MSLSKVTDAVAASLGCKKADAAKSINAVVEAINSVVSAGSPVRLPPLGSFKLTHRKERTARNPQTGESITIAAHNAVVFKQMKR